MGMYPHVTQFETAALRVALATQPTRPRRARGRRGVRRLVHRRSVGRVAAGV